jgi:Co/Zn/Cd efflux system component
MSNYENEKKVVVYVNENKKITIDYNEKIKDKSSILQKPETIKTKKTFDMNKNVNIRAVLIHVIYDALQNLGVLIAGRIIYFKPDYH